MDNLKEMDRFLEKFNLPRLNQEEIEILSWPITITEIKTVIEKKKKVSPKAKAQGFTGEFYQIIFDRILSKNP